MQDIREMEFRDSGSNANTKICFEIRATALHPRLHTEGFSLRPHRSFHKETSTKELNSTLGVHYSTLKYNHLYIRGTRHKAKPQLPLQKRDKA